MTFIFAHPRNVVLFAQILKQLYPKLVELHNYPPRNSFTLKLDNWMTLNRKVLKKLELNKNNETLIQLSNAAPGAIESLFYDLKKKYEHDKNNDLLNSTEPIETLENRKWLKV